MNLIPRSFFFDDDFDRLFVSNPKMNDMKCDIFEENNEYHIVMDVPGYDKKDINIEVKDGYLTIKAVKSSEENSESKKYIRRERVYGEIQRSFALGDVDVDKIDANFDNGTLSIIIPKVETTTSKKITLN
jgi:HSP20 family protein